MRTFVFFVALMFLRGPDLLAGTPASDSNNLRSAPTGEELTAYTVVKITYPVSQHFAGWQLAHKLQYGADQGSVTLKRFCWRDFGETFNSSPMTPEGKVASRKVGKEEILLAKTLGTENTVTATLYVPAELIAPLQGKYALQLTTNFTRSRNTTQEITTWPLALSLDYTNEFNEDRSVELKLSYSHTRISQKTRPSFKDQNGNIISFRNIDSVTIQDGRDATIDAGYYFNLRHNTRLGRVDLGLIAGGEWERDQINLLDQRITPYGGGELSFESETIDDLGMEMSIEIAGSFDRYIIIDTIEEGPPDNPTYTTVRRIEENRLPSIRGSITGRIPLYRLDNVTMILFDGTISVLQSFAGGGGGDEGGFNRSERLGHLEAGIAFQTPIGASLRIREALDWLKVPGEAGDRIASFQWNSSASAVLKLTF